MKIRNRCYFLIVVFLVPVPLAAIEIAPSRYAVGEKAPHAYVPYLSSHPLAEPNRKITRLLFSIHSSGFDAKQYYDNAKAAASKVPGVLAETLIIAPNFFEKKAIPGKIPENMLYWSVSPFRGSSRGAIGPSEKRVWLSSFEVMDDWLASMTDPAQLPRLENVVIVGHSGGGQFVQRYAMVGKYEPQENLKMRFVVSAPSSYAYPSGERLHRRTNRFSVPNAATVKKCPKYDNWGYGLSSPYGYFSKVDRAQIAGRYAKRTVFYLCGGRDNNPNDKALGKSCGAMLQGRHRLERMQILAAFMRFKYGKSIERTHSFAVVRGVGHFGRGNMTSTAGLKALFSTTP